MPLHPISPLPPGLNYTIAGALETHKNKYNFMKA